MKWVNHKLITFSVIYSLSSNLLASIIAAAGSIFPDTIEGFDYNSQSWKRRHRKISHWGIFYLSVCVILFLIVGKDVLTVSFTDVTVFLKQNELLPVMMKWAFWFFTGAFMHVLEDAITGKVPFFHPTEKNFGMRLFRTGSPVEYLVSISIFLIAISEIVLK